MATIFQLEIEECETPHEPSPIDPEPETRIPHWHLWLGNAEYSTSDCDTREDVLRYAADLIEDEEY